MEYFVTITTLPHVHRSEFHWWLCTKKRWTHGDLSLLVKMLECERFSSIMLVHTTHPREHIEESTQWWGGERDEQDQDELCGLSRTKCNYQWLFLPISAILPISYYFWLSLTTSDYLRLPLTISDYLWLSLTISDYLWLSLNISDYLWLSLTI